MATLLLRLAAPLQSWGVDSKFETRRTNVEPTKSGVVGLLAAALGIRRDEHEALGPLNALRFGVRVDQEGKLLADYQNATFEKTNVQSKRYYLSDAVFLVGLESDDEAFFAQLEDALCHPVFSLFLGRRSCPPTPPLCRGIVAAPLEKALMSAPLQTAAWNKSVKKSLRMMVEVDGQTPGATSQRDLPITFSKVHRRYGYRPVCEMDCPLPGEPATEHDPFAEL